jgi:von Willebrand factor type A domain
MTRFSNVRSIHRAALFALLLAGTAAVPLVRAAAKAPVGPGPDPGRNASPAATGRAVEAVFVLDTTGSMSGLIEGAKRKIWSIADAMAGGHAGVPVRIGLVAYRDRGDEYVTRRFGLTEDLDAVWGELRSLEAGGGGDTPESVNQALHEAVTEMGWTRGPGVYRVVFLVGDAPPHLDYQGDVGFRQSAALARQRDIVLNTIQCGGLPDTTPIWQEIASIGQGQFAAIAQDGAMQAVATPYDARLAELNRRLAGTVLPYGKGEEQRRLRAKVARSLEAPAEAAADRLSYLAKRGVANLGRKDLVDAASSGEVDVATLPESELPETLKPVVPEARGALVEKLHKERQAIQDEIASVGAEREAYVRAEEAKARSTGRADGFDGKVLEAVREQAARKGIR